MGVGRGVEQAIYTDEGFVRAQRAGMDRWRGERGRSGVELRRREAGREAGAAAEACGADRSGWRLSHQGPPSFAPSPHTAAPTSDASTRPSSPQPPHRPAPSLTI